MTFLCRQVRSHGTVLRLNEMLTPFSCTILKAFAKMFNSTPDDLDMHVVYDVSHKIAKARGRRVIYLSLSCASPFLSPV